MNKKIELTKPIIKFFEMEAALKVVQDAPGFKFSLLVSMNVDTMTEKLDKIRKKSEKSEALEEILKKQEELRQTFTFDADGKQKTQPVQGQDGQMVDYPVVLDNKVDELNVAIVEFWKDEENDKAKTDYEKQMQEYLELIQKDEMTFELLTIPQESVPVEFFEDKENIEILKPFVKYCRELLEVEVEEVKE